MHRLTEFSLKRPWLTLAILLAITVGLGLGVPKVKPAFGFRVMVGGDHPAMKALDSLVEQFAGGYPVRIAWGCGSSSPCKNVFDKASLEMADALTRDLSNSPNVMSVIGPANASLFIPSDEGFQIRTLYENDVLAPDYEKLSESALEEPLWVGNLVSEDSRAGVIVIQTKDNRPQTELEITSTINKSLEHFRDQGFDFYVLGDAPDNVVVGKALSESTNALIPALALVIAAILYILTRSWRQTLITMTTMGIALVWTLGALGWLHWPQDGMLEVLAPLVVIVGVCDAVHLLTRYSEERQKNKLSPTRDALILAARDAGPACVITTVTSAVAFASFTSSDLDTFVRFGLILPTGVIFCLILSFSLIPIAMAFLASESDRDKHSARTWMPVMNAIAEIGARRSATMLSITAFLLAFFSYGWIVHLRADNDWIEAFGESSQFVQSVRFIEETIGGSQTLELDVRLPPQERIENPETLSAITQLSDSLSTVDGLSEPKSIVDLLRRLNRLLNDNQPSFYRVGDSSKANAELLELIAFDDPETLNRWISVDRSRIRISIPVSEKSQTEREVTIAEVNAHIENHLGNGWVVQPSGRLAIQHSWIRDVQATQLRSFPIAFGIVFILVSVFLRSWKLGLAAMVPTLLPVVVVLGAMGWIGMSLDVARAMLAAVVIGIGVDDAIHLLAHYKVRREEGDDPHAAISAALQHTGRAIVTTSVALALGFLTLMMSAWQTVASFGFFVAIAIIGALVATLFVLPALIFTFTRGEKGGSA